MVSIRETRKPTAVVGQTCAITDASTQSKNTILSKYKYSTEVVLS